MNNFRIGFGFDIHKFKKGRKLFLGGVRIPFKFGLQGHSDADVLLHALCDALLGALAKPDIGQYFSVGVPKYKDISSIYFLEKVKDIMHRERFKVVNLDSVIITDDPEINKFRDLIKTNLSNLLGINKNSIGIKAKTTEGILSYSGKGIASYCVVLLEGGGN